MLEKGMTVRLKNSDQLMTVRRTGNFSPVAVNGVDCVWFDDKRRRRSAIFDAAALVSVQRANASQS
ncbi:DUF2158 domain-containing protein [Massilia sp. Mn16-1_5]|uniref:DUF2158 domain-containing protein n=1 Tax=Massilia sp. Mn16-1_5 TaxID=2079199 RepID=UPI00109E6DB7|nr:hypothetical protein C2862_21110 [Massilia sp. Mn16-1_5]